MNAIALAIKPPFNQVGPLYRNIDRVFLYYYDLSRERGVPCWSSIDYPSRPFEMVNVREQSTIGAQLQTWIGFENGVVAKIDQDDTDDAGTSINYEWYKDLGVEGRARRWGELEIHANTLDTTSVAVQARVGQSNQQSNDVFSGAPGHNFLLERLFRRRISASGARLNVRVSGSFNDPFEISGMEVDVGIVGRGTN